MSKKVDDKTSESPMTDNIKILQNEILIAVHYMQMCHKFVGRQRRLDRLRQLKATDLILDKELHMIQEAYNEMRDTCLQDQNYLASWESQTDGTKDLVK